jgi:hypothetical protein
MTVGEAGKSILPGPSPKLSKLTTAKALEGHHPLPEVDPDWV